MKKNIILILIFILLNISCQENEKRNMNFDNIPIEILQKLNENKFEHLAIVTLSGPSGIESTSDQRIIDKAKELAELYDLPLTGPTSLAQRNLILELEKIVEKEFLDIINSIE